MGTEQKSTACEDILAGGGEMGALMRSHDWSQSLLGSVENWSPSLRIALSICLNSRFPMVIWWGKELVLLYNDAWQPILGTKHPHALGCPGQEVWAEIWDIIGVQLESVLATGQATWSDDTLLLVDRYGYIEEAYFTYSYSPIFLETGEVGGAFTAVTETTQRIIGERRLSTLRELAASTVEAKLVEKTCRIASATLANNPYDIPFALLYLVENNGEQAHLVGTAGLEAGTPASPQQVDLTQETDSWKLAQVRRTAEVEIVDRLTTLFGELPGGAWEESPRSAIVLPIAQAGQTQQLAGLLVLGISPRREFDDEYRGFFDLIASNVATAIANAHAYEAERQRAEALAELDRAKTVFFSNVSHEFRTPLTLMLSPTEDALSDTEVPLPPRQRDRIEVVQRNGLRLLKLVNTLLDFSRIEAGRNQAVYEPTDLAMLTAELASVFRSTIEQAGMQLRVECFPLPEAIFVDREMWEKIVFNLLSNAFKFTLSGTITVRLQWAETHVELAVEDTGIGIPPEELPHLFERFYRVKGSLGRSFEGSGIGLSLVQELVKLHGGTVNVTSVLGQGSCFTVLIPTGKAHLPSERISASRTSVSTTLGAMPYLEEALSWLPEASEFQGVESIEPLVAASQPLTVQESDRAPIDRILLADDNADMRGYIKRLLSSRYIVQTVADGIAALAAMRENPPNLVLTDVMMPGMDGFEVLRSLRSNPQTQDIPIILLSARAGEESRIEGLEAGADDYLIKPFSARELLARIEANLKLAQLRRTARVREQTLRLEAEMAEANLQTVLSSLRDGFLTLDRNWCYTYINDRQTEIIGMRREDLIGKNVWEVFPDLVDTELYQQFERVMTERTPRQFEYYYAAWNRWFENRIYPIPDGIAILCAEITERKQAEAALRQSEERFRNMADNAPVMVWVTDPTAYCTYLSQSWYDFSGQTEETGLGFGWLDVIHPEDYENSKNIFLAANERHEAFRLEYRLRHQDGEYRSCIDAASPWFGLDGQFKGYIGSVIDISDRKQAEMLVREAEARLRLALESTELGTWDLNPITSELKWDNRCKAMFGMSPDATVNYDVFLAGLHPEDRDRTQAAVGQALSPAGKGEYDIEYRTVGIEDGVERWIAAKGKAVFNQAGEAVRFIGTVLNITEKKRVEIEREQLLQREQTARAEAERANQIKDEFLAVLSHELRTPLNPILGWSRLLQNGKLNAAKTIEALATIERNAKLQVQLIDDLLDISRILRGKLVFDATPVDLGSVIFSALETVRLAANAKSLRIQTEITPMVSAIGDATRLQQVMWNLLSNAVKFTPQGGQIEVHLTPVGTNAQIQVRDTGKGIRAEFLPYVFDHFQQEDGSTTRKFGGLGLGLAIVRQIVELHGGTVKVDSRGEGQGATFTVQIPLAPESVEMASIVRSPEPTRNLSGIQVLVVDDDADSREFIAFVLEQENAIVTTVSSGADALQAFSQSLPHIVVSDIGMPEIDGYMLMRQIRMLPPEQGGCVPAIALTAYAGELDRQQAIKVGFQRHIAKPIDPNAVVELVVELVRRRK